MGRLDSVQLTLVDSTDEVANFLSWLGERRPIMAADTETTGLHLSKDHIRLVQFGDAKHGWAIPYEDWRGLVKHTLATYEGPIAWHNAKFDAGMLIKDGMPFDWTKTHDTMPMAFLNDSLGPKGLKPAAARYVDTQARLGQDALKNAMSKNKWTWGSVPIDHPLYWGYACLDTILTAMLAEELWQPVQKYRAAYDLELATARILSGMELRGVRIDIDYCAEQHRELRWKLQTLLQELEPLNPFSTQQVAKALQAEGVQLTKLTPSGKLAIDDDVLSRIDSELARKVRTAKSLDKMIGAYFGNFLEYRDGDILHPHINQLAARTGRMSVSQPALQQVPKNAYVRDAFIAREGNRLVLADYDNQELRVAAHFSGDVNMIDAFETGRDLHMETAVRVYGEELGPSMRSNGKRAIFAKAYGAGVPKFAATINVTEAEAQKIFSAIEEVYPGLNSGMAAATAKVRERAADDANESGYVVVGDGRHIRVKANKAYVGFNALIQGTCAVVLKRALVDLDAAGLGDTLILPIHDEVMFDIPEADVAEAQATIEEVMRRDDYRIPLPVSSDVVNRWGDKYRTGEIETVEETVELAYEAPTDEMTDPTVERWSDVEARE